MLSYEATNCKNHWWETRQEDNTSQKSQLLTLTVLHICFYTEVGLITGESVRFRVCGIDIANGR